VDPLAHPLRPLVPAKRRDREREGRAPVSCRAPSPGRSRIREKGSAPVPRDWEEIRRRVEPEVRHAPGSQVNAPRAAPRARRPRRHGAWMSRCHGVHRSWRLLRSRTRPTGLEVAGPGGVGGGGGARRGCNGGSCGTASGGGDRQIRDGRCSSPEADDEQTANESSPERIKMSTRG
jgi:hypothetical protein